VALVPAPACGVRRRATLDPGAPHAFVLPAAARGRRRQGRGGADGGGVPAAAVAAVRGGPVRGVPVDVGGREEPLAVGGGRHGEEAVGQHGVVVDAAGHGHGPRRRGLPGQRPARGVDGRPLAALHRQQVCVRRQQPHLPGHLQAARRRREDGAHPGARRGPPRRARGPVQLRGRLPLPPLPPQHCAGHPPDPSS
jgi:hypothetical protein